MYVSERPRRPSARGLLVGASLKGTVAIPEEIAFRWLSFLGVMPLLYIVDQASFGAFQWVNLKVFIPFVDLSSLYLMSEHLYSDDNPWLIGAAVASSNSVFRNGHAYQGWIGWTSSWFTGLYYFGLMFNFGLVVAIVGHFLFNVTIELVSLGWIWRRIQVLPQ